MTAVIHLGASNSKNRLSQAAWSQYLGRIRWHIKTFKELSKGVAHHDAPGAELLGEWFSAPDGPNQDVRWAIAVPDDVEPERMLAFQEVLAACAGNHNQDPISWSYSPTTLFLGPEGTPDAAANAVLETRPE